MMLIMLKTKTRFFLASCLVACFAGALGACETRVIHDGSPEAKFNRPTNLNSIQHSGETKINKNDPMWK